ncbi:asparagine synthetase B [Sphingomonas parva]|uniref:asparagine synthase (glutamine-hydrolyzing) n=1 Tax=Sphingomonas parva TaxID=2555898 RepID=A0A4Y8ZSR9_9SPHN|nr:asparagine synthase-related protein [Sphingomonas parva]TFI58332.1 asparagine synthetase B [Sphingomonas parva]
MTALAGFWSYDSSGDSERACERMLAAQQVYAPAPAIFRAEGAMAIGRRLHAALPEDRFDRGPVAGESGRSLVADVRIDNRDELEAALGLTAGEAATLSDAGLLMRTLDRWDEGALDRLVGDFAFALWDPKRGRLLLARDHAGQRPLHYHCGRGFFAFASMAKGLHALEQVPVAPNRETLVDFLALLPEGTGTFFEGVEKVRAGHLLSVSPEGVSSRAWWRPSPATLRLARSEDYAEALREQLDRAVAARLRGAEGRVASHLSGGLDSAATTSTAARLLGSGQGSVIAYTAVPRPGYEAAASYDSFADEGPLAARVAGLYPNIEHVRLPASGASPVERLDRNFFLYERPLLNLCNGVWLHAILDDAKRRRLGVLLTGQQGNMTISYDGMPYLAESLGGGHLFRVAKLAWQLRRWGTRWGTIAAAAAGPYVPVPLWQWIARRRGRGRSLSDYSAIAPARAEDPQLAARAAARALDPSYRPRRNGLEARLWVVSRVDPGNYNKGMIGGWGVDVRDPTADRRLMEFCLSVPAEEYLAGGVPRSLARRAFADRLPREVVGERRKGYQAADWHEALGAGRADLAEELARIAELPGVDADLDVARLQQLASDWPQDWPSGGWLPQEQVDRYRLALLRGVSAGHFLRKALGSNY